jgi:Spy/CpxP family protein refolding chaperone
VTARVWFGIAALALGAATHAEAQAPARSAQTLQQRAPDSVGRARLESAIRRGFAQAARRRVGLSDAQINQLAPIMQRYEQQRRQLLRDERDARVSLRAQMRNEQTADATKVDQLLQRLVDVQKRRVQLVEAEQRELATVMTPLQRAKFMALQEQIRRRMEEMRERRSPR